MLMVSLFVGRQGVEGGFFSNHICVGLMWMLYGCFAVIFVWCDRIYVGDIKFFFCGFVACVWERGCNEVLGSIVGGEQRKRTRGFGDSDLLCGFVEDVYVNIFAWV